MAQQGLTNKEAVERLKCMRLFMQINDKDSTSKFLDEDYVANDMAVKSLEKQIPKKVVKQHEEPTDDEIKELIDLGFCGGDVIRCPNCNEYIVIDKLKYCMECGQRLDWNDTN